jgi:hypothetical protein
VTSSDQDIVRLFYESALSEAERASLAQARGIRGLAEEAALLRVRLRSVLEERPEDSEVLFAGVRLLVNVLLAQHRLTGQQAEDLAGSVAATFEHFVGIVRDLDVAS